MNFFSQPRDILGGSFLLLVGVGGVGGISHHFCFVFFGFFFFLCFYSLFFLLRFSPNLPGQEQLTAICRENGQFHADPVCTDPV